MKECRVGTVLLLLLTVTRCQFEECLIHADCVPECELMPFPEGDLGWLPFCRLGQCFCEPLYITP